ncbi:type IV pilus assembly protein PilN [Chitinivorax tropicus]|uniref:Type IV pilus assembly protein PilN n=1 Tax=Chitinivorax tropicus TaxID=714531 RepID=A0A840MJY6_9PROT|nr:PilN domain-containing protein [Chitinivorax tropicus]MBB5017479.1 type IV pilus assembly protein PilN [Chitinivorax tropicus]
MIRINLLPHREAKRKARAQRFAAIVGFTVVAGGLIVLAGYTLLEERLNTQTARNDFLKAEISRLDREISEIEVLKAKRKDLLDRKKVIEKLQANRSEVVRMLDQVTRQTPDGIYYKEIKQKGDVVTLIGYSLSNARVSTLMRALNDTPAFEMPNLEEIKAMTVENQRLNQFTMNSKLKRQSDTEQKPGDKSKEVKK